MAYLCVKVHMKQIIFVVLVLHALVLIWRRMARSSRPFSATFKRFAQEFSNVKRIFLIMAVRICVLFCSHPFIHELCGLNRDVPPSRKNASNIIFCHGRARALARFGACSADPSSLFIVEYTVCGPRIPLPGHSDQACGKNLRVVVSSQ